MNLNTHQNTSTRVIIGKCGKCGGIVSTPSLWFGTTRAPQTCESCGAEADRTAHLPTLPMK
jgi:hypothetical protein